MPLSLDEYKAAVLDRVIYESKHAQFVIDCWRYHFPVAYAVAWLQRVYDVV